MKKTTKTYDILLKEKPIYENLSEEEFHNIWDMMNKFISITSIVEKEDLHYQIHKI